MEKKVTIKIPRELYKKLKDIIKDTGFSSVTEFIVYAMRNIVSGGKLKGEDQLTNEEVRKVRERLRKLGYIDWHKMMNANDWDNTNGFNCRIYDGVHR